MWWVKLGIAFVSVIIGVFLGLVSIFFLCCAVSELSSTLGEPAIQNRNGILTESLLHFITAILLGVISWFLTTVTPLRLFRPTNLHPKVLARLAK